MRLNALCFYLVFRHIVAQISHFFRGGPPGGFCARNTRNTRVALRATDAGPLNNALVPTSCQGRQSMGRQSMGRQRLGHLRPTRIALRGRCLVGVDTPGRIQVSTCKTWRVSAGDSDRPGKKKGLKVSVIEL